MKTSKLDHSRLGSVSNLKLHIYPASTPQSNRLQRLWQAFLKFAEGSQEPRIRQVCDRQGNSTWRVYDPISGQSMSFASEAEVRLWLEQRYRA